MLISTGLVAVALGLGGAPTEDPDAPAMLLDRGGTVLHYEMGPIGVAPIGEPDRVLAMRTELVQRLRVRLGERPGAVRPIDRDGVPLIQVLLPGVRGPDADPLAEELARPGSVEFRFLAEGSGQIDVDFERRRLAQEGRGLSGDSDLSHLSVEGFGAAFHWTPMHPLFAEDWAIGRALPHEPGQTHFVLVEHAEDAVFDERSLAAVSLERDHAGQPALGIELSAAAGARFGAFTEAGVGRKLAVIVDGEVLSAPEVRSRVSTRAVISGGNRGFPADELERLVRRLDQSRQHGRLPCALRLVDRVEIP